jgi:glucokinase
LTGVHAASGCVVGVDLGGTKLLAGALAPDGTVLHRARRPATGLTREVLLDMVVDAVEEARGAVGGELVAAGFGIPCTFDRRTGLAVQAVHQPLEDFPFAAAMRERLGLPVAVDNDGNCAVLAEARAGAGEGAQDVVLLTLGTGIAGGLVLGGRIYRGWIGAGAELGHMVVDADGPRCQGNCPNRGCLEAVASGSALVRDTARRLAVRRETPLGRAVASGRALDGPLITEMAGAGDPVAQGAVEALGRALGVGLANLVNIFNPEVIVVGGGVMGAGEMLLEPAREVMLSRALPPARDVVRVVPAAFGHEAGMLGAAWLAREEAE